MFDNALRREAHISAARAGYTKALCDFMKRLQMGGHYDYLTLSLLANELISEAEGPCRSIFSSDLSPSLSQVPSS